MAPLRLRHPKGVSTLNLDLTDASSATVNDLQRQIFAETEIPPAQQDLKTGYPPRSLEVIPELPLSSLGLRAGDQLIVTERAGRSVQAAPPTVPTSTRPPPARSGSFGSFGAARGSAGQTGGADFVETSTGALVHRIVPDDNSCLFSSVALVFEQGIGRAQSIRQIVADAIKSDMETWSEAILGQSRETYIATILRPTAWGGAIELSILAKHYKTEISSIDVETGRVDRFEPPSGTSTGNRCILIYSGIHYDAATLAPTPDAPADFHQTVFPVMGAGDDDPIIRAGKQLAGKLREKKAYTNTATFDLKCEVCKKGLKGEKEAREHAKQTGHTDFGEY